MSEKPGIFTRIKYAIFGAPISHEEQQAAQASQFRDARAEAHFEVGNQRFHTGGF